jgi:hypothetical protein
MKNITGGRKRDQICEVGINGIIVGSNTFYYSTVKAGNFVIDVLFHHC